MYSLLTTPVLGALAVNKALDTLSMRELMHFARMGPVPVPVDTVLEKMMEDLTDVAQCGKKEKARKVDVKGIEDGSYGSLLQLVIVANQEGKER